MRDQIANPLGDGRSPNYINHIALVLDASVSMTKHARELVKVADAEIAHLARRSQQLDQETRVTVYIFSDDVECIIYDKDVLRLPSIAPYYAVTGNTALIAAMVQSQEDLAKTAQLYGDHAFLTYVLTDGEENVSRYTRRFNDGIQGDPRKHWPTRCTTEEVVRYLSVELRNQPDNWTVACLVPNARGAYEAKKFGFPGDNIAVWDATSGDGVAEIFSTVRTATESFMAGRARGIRGSKTLFAGGTDQVNTRNVNASMGFRPLGRDAYSLYDVREWPDLGLDIRPYVEYITSAAYRTGSAFYELTKPEKIQPQKVIMVRNRKSGRVHTGPDARKLLNLPDHEVRVKPETNPEFQIFVQSTSVNRKLVPGTKLLVLS